MKHASQAPRLLSLRTGSLLLAIVGFGGVGLNQGCVISFSEVQCDECDSSSLCHNHLGGDGLCYCDAGYTDMTPGDEDFECEEVRTRPAGSMCVNDGNVLIGDWCECVEGYTWCSDDPDDFTCCLDPSQDSLTGVPDSDSGQDTFNDDSTTTSGTTGTTTSSTSDTTSTTGTDTTGSTTDMRDPPDPADCTEDGLVACSNDDPENPVGSVFWYCEGGVWSERPDLLTEMCVADGYDFAHGCANNFEAQVVEPICDLGPGTPCDMAATPDACVDDVVVQYCQWGALVERDCHVACTMEGDVTYSYGFCNDADGIVTCDCCDYPENNACPPLD